MIQLFGELEKLSYLAVEQYSIQVDLVIAGQISDEDEIAHIMDGMLDFCQYDNMLQLFKRFCRMIYSRYPLLVSEYIMLYKDLWGDGEENYSKTEQVQEEGRGRANGIRIGG